MNNLIQDISVLTDVSESTLKKFIPIVNSCIGHTVHESRCCNKEVSEIDLGFGELHLKVDPSGIRYKFIPSKELEKLIVKTLSSKQSPISITIEKNLEEKILRAFKELL